MSTDQQQTFAIESTASKEQQWFRSRLLSMFESSPLPPEEKLFNIGLYTGSSVLAKFLVMNDLYLRAKTIPGQLIEFGTWWGQNLILLENLRAIHEPFNKQRIIVGFDTFDGYAGMSGRDKESRAWVQGSYNTGKEYQEHLRELLEVHEGSNVLGQIRGCHRLIVGNVEKTASEYFDNNPQALVALAYFDLGLYAPTRAALLAIKPHLVSGSILLLDEFTWQESPGEAIAFKETFSRGDFKIEKCALYPSKAIVTIM
jgi:hypothetical protein